MSEHMVGEFHGHKPGAIHCQLCWRGRTLTCTCGGRIHCEYGEDRSGGYYVVERCDRCGEHYVQMSTTANAVQRIAGGDSPQ